MAKLEKKSYFGTFFWKIDFWSFFLKLKIFGIKAPQNFFLHHFPISQVLNYSFMQKKLEKIIFSALRELYLKKNFF
jgi:hypothetical protein